MLAEARRYLKIERTNKYDGDLAMWIEAGALDLESAGVIIPGTIAFQYNDDEIVDKSTMKNPKIMVAIVTYAAAHASAVSPEDQKKYGADYESMKTALMNTNGYTDFWKYESGDC